MTTTQIALGLIRTSKGNPRKHVEALAGLHEQGGEGVAEGVRVQPGLAEALLPSSS